jgi:hypothetical protein
VGDGVGDGDGDGDGVGASVHVAMLHTSASLRAASQACATPAEGVLTDRALLAMPGPQTAEQSLHADHADMVQSIHIGVVQGVVSASPSHWAPPKAPLSIMNLERDESPAAPDTINKFAFISPPLARLEHATARTQPKTA